MTTVNEVSTDKTKVPVKFIFRSVLIVCFNYCRARRVNWFTINVHEAVIKTLWLQCKRTMASLFNLYVSVRYSLLFSSKIILEQLFTSGSVNIVE